MSYEILEKLRKEISGFKEEKGAREVGIVSEVGDGILRISGLSGALAQELLSVEAQSEEIPALAFNLEENFIGAVILGDGDKVRVGARDRKTGKTAIALDAILNQLQDEGRRKAVSIYVAIGQKNSKIAKTIAMLEERGAMKNTIVVSASASSPASLQYLAPFAGAAIGEYFMDSGMDAVIIYDDLSKHADAYRQLSLLLRRPPGREAYPGDIFYLHARLLERSAKLSKEKGGGSLTALPIIETKLGDVSSYIPTNVISITDGQIYLESGLFYQGVRPAVNVGLSVSRVGSAAQTKAMKKVAGKMRLELAQFRELAAFVQFSSDLDPDTKKKIARGELLTEILKQADLEPAPFEKAVVILYAALSGAMDNIPIPEAQSYASGLLDWLEKLHRDEILGAIRKSSDFTDEVEEKLKAAIKDYGISAKS